MLRNSTTQTNLPSTILYPTTVAVVTRARTILISFGMGVRITLVMNFRVWCVIMHNSVWLYVRG